MVKKHHILKKRWVGKTVCCCDLKHRVVAEVSALGLAIMDDGQMYDIYHCLQKVQEDGECHKPYETPVGERGKWWEPNE